MRASKPLRPVLVGLAILLGLLAVFARVVWSSGGSWWFFAGALVLALVAVAIAFVGRSDKSRL